MDRMDQQWAIHEGANVVGSDDHKVGEVVAIHADYIVVEKGFFFPTDYYIPTRAIANYDGDKVFLNVTKDEAIHQGWETLPADGTVTAAGGYATDMGATDVTVPDTGTTATPTAPEPPPIEEIPPPPEADYRDNVRQP